jgi:Ca-activated chloride channel family protein
LTGLAHLRLLDTDVVALESEDEITVAIDLEALNAVHDKQQPPSSLEAVLDCSGSMGDGRLEAAKEALVSLVGRYESSTMFAHHHVRRRVVTHHRVPVALV